MESSSQNEMNACDCEDLRTLQVEQPIKVPTPPFSPLNTENCKSYSKIKTKTGKES